MKLLRAALLPLTLLAFACGGDDGDGPTTEVVALYAANASANYSATLSGATALKTAVDAFVDSPTTPNLEAAKTAWLAAREPYLRTEVYRFYDGPIDNPEDGPEGELNAWPLDEAYIDYVEGMPTAGIINNTGDFPTITTAVIKEQNENGGEANISAGYHAIEFLLWGQDHSTTGPGARPATDYALTGGTAANPDRRGTYLKLVTQLLVDDLTQVTEQWAPNQQNYRATFETEGKGAVQKMFLGLGSLSGAELSGERMTVALNNRDQEDEHSCFSDNTHRDLIGDGVGIQQIYLGVRDDIDGPGLQDLVRAKDSALATKLETQIAASVAALEAIPHPFDQAIMNDAGRALVSAAIQALQTQTETTVEAATALGITINLE